MTALDTLLTDLDAFFSEHRGCTTDLVGGLLDDRQGGVTFFTSSEKSAGLRRQPLDHGPLPLANGRDLV